MKWLDRLRALPHHKKQQVAFVSSFSITAFIFLIWLGATMHSFVGGGAEVQQAQSLSPFASLVKQVEDLSSDIKNAF